jgi:hypothetical protein
MRSADAIHSRLYAGYVRHRRFGAKPHRFRYAMYWCYLDLAELPQLFDRHWLWSARRPNLAYWRRSDYLGDPAVPLDQAVRACIAERLGRAPTGPIRMLTQVRHFGYCFNPVTVYYCHDEAGRLDTIVAEITNTPWRERHRHILPDGQNVGSETTRRFRFGKEFHISPFFDQDYDCDWRFGVPGDQLAVHMENRRQGELAFDATFTAKAKPITSASLAWALARFPFATGQIILGIYWQALRLKLKGVPYVPHPGKISPPRPAAPLFPGA